MFPVSVEHMVYNRQFRNADDKLESLVNLSSQVELVSALHSHFPLCMPDLRLKHLQFVHQFVGATTAIDLLFPEHRVRAYRKCHELIVAPKKSWGYKRIHELPREKVEFEGAPAMPVGL